MDTEQDKELQTFAFEIFKHKDLSVDGAYDKAKEFLDEKRSKDNLRIIPSDSIKISAKSRVDYNKNIVFDFNYFKNNLFLVDELRFSYCINDGQNVKRVVDYVLTEVNKQLKIKGCITNSVEVKIHQSEIN